MSSPESKLCSCGHADTRHPKRMFHREARRAECIDCDCLAYTEPQPCSHETWLDAEGNCSDCGETLPVAVDPAAYVKVKAQRDRLAAALRAAGEMMLSPDAYTNDDFRHQAEIGMTLLREVEGG